MRRFSPIAGLALAAAAFGSCLEPFHTPSAYDTQRFLCDGGDAPFFPKNVLSCRQAIDAGQGCAGFISFKGEMEGRPTIVESALTSTAFASVPDDAGLELDYIETQGESPFYRFLFKMISIGPPAADGGIRALQTNGSPNTLADPLHDDLVRVTIRVFGSSSLAFNSSAGGAVTIESETPDEVIGRFKANFDQDKDPIEGCFMAAKVENRVETVPQP